MAQLVARMNEQERTELWRRELAGIALAETRDSLKLNALMYLMNRDAGMPTQRIEHGVADPARISDADLIAIAAPEPPKPAIDAADVDDE